MEKVKLGVVGAGAANLAFQYCNTADNAVLMSVYDSNALALEKFMQRDGAEHITTYTDYAQFLTSGIDAIAITSELATDQTPLCVQALEAGKHVLAGLVPCETMAEAVQLVEAVEKNGKVFAFGETHSYFTTTMEMRRLYQEGKLGELEYAEGEYLHNVESMWPDLTNNNDPTHWRNTVHAIFYCPHGYGPIIHATGLRPVRVTAFEGPYTSRFRRMGAKGGPFAILMLELENGAIVKGAYGYGPSRSSTWYSMYGSLGRVESARDDAEAGDVYQLYTNLDTYEGENNMVPKAYRPVNELTPDAQKYFSHGGSHYYCMWNFVEKVKGNPKADTVDVYEAIDMTIPGILGYRGILRGGIPMDIPNFRDPAQREPYRNDNACTTPEKAGDQLLPNYSKPID